MLPFSEKSRITPDPKRSRNYMELFSGKSRITQNPKRSRNYMELFSGKSRIAQDLFLRTNKAKLEGINRKKIALLD